MHRVGGDAYLSKQGVLRIPPARRIIQQGKCEHGGGGLRPGWLPGSFERVTALALRGGRLDPYMGN